MRRLISILFMSLLLLQAIPVLHFFSSQKEIFYVYIDEEKPDNSVKEKKYGKEYLFLTPPSLPEKSILTGFPFLQEDLYKSPLPEAITPPPNITC
ncbi:MAG TPA: hypothetical protein VMR70_03385 [Flavisolibacter sp.]|nr:hypothetical protein [Flavisolibacter sp.]